MMSVELAVGDRTRAAFAGHDPKLIEGDVFRFELEIDEADSEATPQATPQAEAVVKYCSVPRTRSEIQEHLGLKDREYFRSDILQPLLDAGLLEMTIPDKPTSPNQKYVAAAQLPATETAEASAQ